ncbi:MAG: type II CRISPR-associated endonuclease Cas1 [Flavobacteriaceae bacterium]|nr:type II CRISPR-associated endonuclease Cas1 [Flavobacteriaceae bacterium]
MIKRTVYIGNPAYLKLRNGQLVVQEPEGDIKGTVPIEDIAMLMLDNYRITISNQLLIQLQSNNSVVISCDAQHLPFGMMLPLYGHTEYSEKLKYQLNVAEPLKKQLWKQTIVSKIKNQEFVLKKSKREFERMSYYIENIKSGDTSNMEAKAAKYYWKNITDGFIRDREGSAPNNFLNFTYSVLRSIVARALVSSGLLPVLGIFHKNKYNPYCLADDIMEPYRPFADKLVFDCVNKYGEIEKLSKEHKEYLLSIATHDVVIDKVNRPLMVAVSITTASLYKCYTGERRTIKYPTFV